MSPAPEDPSVNRLLAALPAEVYSRLRPGLEPFAFALGDVVYDSRFGTERALPSLYARSDERGEFECDHFRSASRIWAPRCCRCRSTSRWPVSARSQT